MPSIAPHRSSGAIEEIERAEVGGSDETEQLAPPPPRPAPAPAPARTIWPAPTRSSATSTSELLAAQEALENSNIELTRVNEELTWVNDQLERRNQECGRINGDLLNLIAAVDIPMFIVDTEQRVRLFTPKAEVLLDVTAADIGTRLSVLPLKVVGAPDLAVQIAAVMAGQRVKESEVRDRQGRWYRLQIRPYQTADNRIDGAILSLVDIDALRRVVADALAARTEAERANGAKDQFLATLSHELRTPLTSILVNAQMLLEKEPDLPQRRRAYEAIARGTRVQKQLIDDLLDVSGIVSGKTRMEVRAVDLRAVVMMAIEQARLSAERKSIKLDDRGGSGGPGGGGPGAARAGGRQPAQQRHQVHARRWAGGGQAGWRPAMRPCSRSPTPGSASIPASCRRCSSASPRPTNRPPAPTGGWAWASPSPATWSTCTAGPCRPRARGPAPAPRFTVRLPRLTVRTEALEMAGPLPMTGLLAGWDRLRARGPAIVTVRPRILVVDDDRDTREAVAEMLGQTGALVRVAGSAAAALQVFAEFEPTLILSDIAMPGEDGCSLLRKIRARGPEPRRRRAGHRADGAGARGRPGPGARGGVSRVRGQAGRHEPPQAGRADAGGGGRRSGEQPVDQEDEAAVEPPGGRLPDHLGPGRRAAHPDVEAQVQVGQPARIDHEPLPAADDL